MKGKTSVIIYIVVLLVLVLAVGLVFRFTDVKDKVDDIINPIFHVEYDGKQYTGSENKITLPSSGQVKFTVKGGTFQIKITPNVTEENDFSYIVGNTRYRYSNENVGSIFLNEETFQDNTLTIDCAKDYSLGAVLSALHDGAEIEIEKELAFPYLLTVTSGGNVITIAFGGEVKTPEEPGPDEPTSEEPTEITVTPEHIVF